MNVISVVRLKSNLKMRFFTSFRYVQNDSKLGWYGHLGGLVLRLRRKTNPPKCPYQPNLLSF